MISVHTCQPGSQCTPEKVVMSESIRSIWSGIRLFPCWNKKSSFWGSACEEWMEKHNTSKQNDDESSDGTCGHDVWGRLWPAWNHFISTHPTGRTLSHCALKKNTQTPSLARVAVPLFVLSPFSDQMPVLKLAILNTSRTGCCNYQLYPLIASFVYFLLFVVSAAIIFFKSFPAQPNTVGVY